MRQPIRRQHEATTISELKGAKCEALLAVCPAEQPVVGPVYLKTAGVWHRFYLDAGVLFWADATEPDAEDDLLDDERYVDWCQQLGVAGSRIEGIEMRASVLRLSFENGASVILRHAPRDPETRIVSLTSKVR